MRSYSRRGFAVLVLACLPVSAVELVDVWKAGNPQAQIVSPRLAGPMAAIVDETLNGYTSEMYGWKLPISQKAGKRGVIIAVGNSDNNAPIGDLVRQGIDVSVEGLGDEGFRILTHAAGELRYVIVVARTPLGLKYGCQELVFFHMPVSARRASVEWPINIRRTPQFAYRGIYMLPCWAQHDSVAHWRRVLKFNSEITLNRNWFWLDGFPLLPQYGGEYSGTDLSQPENVRSLVELCRREGMKFLIGGGWDTWHQRKMLKGDLDRCIQYYCDLVALLPGAEGIYLEPVGEGGERTEEAVSLKSVDALRRMAESIWRQRPEFEFAIAIGKFNPKAYREAVHAIDQKRMYWWWCWGDPTRDKALSEHPLVLRWHTIVQMSSWHGLNDAPKPEEAALTGFATSYDPGMGFGNRWNGRGYGVGTGISGPREFHPHNIPYFAHEYWFRERAWDVNATYEEFIRRLGRRLFDEDMQPEAIRHYAALQEMCRTPRRATDAFLGPIEAFVKAHASSGTPRNRDTVSRMREAIDGFRKMRSEPERKR